MNSKTFAIGEDGSGGTFVWRDSMEDRSTTRVTRKFFQGLLTGMCNQSYRHWKWERDHYPLAYGERYLYSQMAAAADRLDAYHLSEHSVRRNSRESVDDAGRVDLWAHYRDIHFLIEAKRATFGFLSSDWPQGLRFAARSAFNQARSLTREVRTDWVGTSVLVGLCVCLPYSTGPNKDTVRKLDTSKSASEFLTRARAAMTSGKVHERPNFAAAWTPPKAAQLFETGKDKWERIPFVGFLGRAIPAIAKK